MHNFQTRILRENDLRRRGAAHRGDDGRVLAVKVATLLLQVVSVAPHALVARRIAIAEHLRMVAFTSTQWCVQPYTNPCCDVLRPATSCDEADRCRTQRRSWVARVACAADGGEEQYTSI